MGKDWQRELPTTTTIKQRYQHLLSHKHRECQSELCVCVASIVFCCVLLVGGASLQPPDEDGVGVQVMSEIYVFCLAAICSVFFSSTSPSLSLSLSL